MSDFHDAVACGCQQLAEDSGKDWLAIVVSLPDSPHALAFMKAAGVIEASLENTTVRVVSFAKYRDGEPPPPGSDVAGGPWYLAGAINGPERCQIPEEQREEIKEAWFRDVIAILESHGLEEEKLPAWALN
jgi:hypothetical protein